jgi:hypothetical protein
MISTPHHSNLSLLYSHIGRILLGDGCELI